MYAIAQGGVVGGGYGHRKRVCTESGLWVKKPLLRTEESNLRQRHAAPMLYQLSHIPNIMHDIMHCSLLLQCWCPYFSESRVAV